MMPNKNVNAALLDTIRAHGIVALALPYGTDYQVDHINLFHELASIALTAEEKEARDSYCLKATDEEQIDYVWNLLTGEDRFPYDGPRTESSGDNQ